LKPSLEERGRRSRAEGKEASEHLSERT
jgi:hypothetical protein